MTVLKILGWFHFRIWDLKLAMVAEVFFIFLNPQITA
jgi:hypothetical protein